MGSTVVFSIIWERTSAQTVWSMKAIATSYKENEISNVTKVTKKIIINYEKKFIHMLICTSKGTTLIYRKTFQLARTLARL